MQGGKTDTRPPATINTFKRCNFPASVFLPQDPFCTHKRLHIQLPSPPKRTSLPRPQTGRRKSEQLSVPHLAVTGRSGGEQLHCLPPHGGECSTMSPLAGPGGGQPCGRRQQSQDQPPCPWPHSLTVRPSCSADGHRGVSSGGV